MTATTKPVDVLAVVDAMAELARDAAHLEINAYLELTDERLEELDARYGNVPRAAKIQQALLRFTQARADAIEARAAIAELIAADVEYDEANAAVTRCYEVGAPINIKQRAEAKWKLAGRRRASALKAIQGENVGGGGG